MTSLSHGTSLTGSAQFTDPNAIERAVKTLRDSVDGYRTAAEEVDNPALAALLNELSTARRSAYDTVVTSVAGTGIDIPDDPGTLAAAVHRGWMQVKGALVGDDAIIAAALRGEHEASADLSRALEEDSNPGIEEALRRAMLDVERAKERLEDLSD